MFNEGGNLLAVKYFTCSSSGQENGTWSINGNFIIIGVYEDGVLYKTAFPILELSSSKLRYKVNYSNYYDGYDIYEFVRE
jgi:hypothetical protein